MLANTLLRIGRVTREELFKALVSYEAGNEIINYASKGIISAQSFIKRLLLRLLPC